MFWVLFVQYVSGQDNDSRGEGGGGAGVFFVLWRVDPLRDHGCVNIDSVRLASGLVSTAPAANTW